MNKIYRTLWSAVRQGVVVCNEHHRSHGKEKSREGAQLGRALIPLIAAGLTGAGTVWAEDLNVTTNQTFQNESLQYDRILVEGDATKPKATFTATTLEADALSVETKGEVVLTGLNSYRKATADESGNDKGEYLTSVGTRLSGQVRGTGSHASVKALDLSGKQSDVSLSITGDSTLAVATDLKQAGSSVTLTGTAAGKALAEDGTLLRNEDGRPEGLRAQLEVKGDYSLESYEATAARLAVKAGDVTVGKLIVNGRADISLSADTAQPLDEDGREVTATNAQGTLQLATAKTVAGTGSTLTVKGAIVVANSDAAGQAVIKVASDSSLSVAEGAQFVGNAKLALEGVKASSGIIGEDGQRYEENGRAASLLAKASVDSLLLKSDMTDKSAALSVIAGQVNVHGDMALEGYTSSTLQGWTSTRKIADGSDYTTVLGAKQSFLEAGTQSSLTVGGKFRFGQTDNGKTSQITFNHGATFTANAAEQNGQTSLYVYGAPAGQVLDVDGTLWQDENGRNAGVRGTLKVTDAYVLRGDNALGANKGKATLSAAGSDLEIGSLVMENGANVSLGGQSAYMLNDDGTEVVVQAQNGNKSIKTAKVQDSHSVLKVNDIVEMRNAPETAVQAQTIGVNDGSELDVQGLSLNGWTQVSVFGLADGEDYIGVDGRRLMNPESRLMLTQSLLPEGSLPDPLHQRSALLRNKASSGTVDRV